MSLDPPFDDDVAAAPRLRQCPKCKKWDTDNEPNPNFPNAVQLNCLNPQCGYVETIQEAKASARQR